MKSRLILVLAGSLVLAHAALAQPPGIPRPPTQIWFDSQKYEQMLNAGWKFQNSFGAPEHKCYAFPPKVQLPKGQWSLQETRDAAVAAGAKRFNPHPEDNLCYAEDAQ